ncbi:MAG: ABC transporter permease, partial [Methylobacteriaceae bacterium]|nr:ABC transporter permease [Methylobacteriaceae bacterium]
MKHSMFARFVHEYCKNRVAVVALVVLLFIVFMALFAPFVAPQDPYMRALLKMRDAKLVPGAIGSAGYVHWLGTDMFGRDMYSTILYGLRISLQIGLASCAIAFAIGIVVGCSAAYIGGRFENFIMRVVDLQLSFPAILLAMVISAILGPGRWQLTLALVFAQYAYFTRTAHGSALAESRKDYIEAALSIPLGSWRVVTRYILPNAIPPLIVVAMVQSASAILLEATLSFLGVGLPA